MKGGPAVPAGASAPGRHLQLVWPVAT